MCAHIYIQVIEQVYLSVGTYCMCLCVSIQVRLQLHLCSSIQCMELLPDCVCVLVQVK